MQTQNMDPIHPGEVLLEDWLKPMHISQYALAKAIGVPARRINEIVHGKRAITADTALRLGRYFNVHPQSWLNLQSHYDLKTAQIKLGERLQQEMQVCSPGYRMSFVSTGASFGEASIRRVSVVCDVIILSGGLVFYVR